MSKRGPVRAVLVAVLAVGAASALAQTGESRIDVGKPLDLFLILDASRSLYLTDPNDHRLQAATALVRDLPDSADIRVGVVAFDTDAWLVTSLTSDLESVVEGLQTIGRSMTTNLHDGIDLALQGFESESRPGAARVGLLFTDGKSKRKKALAAAGRARDDGVVLHTVLLHDRRKSERLLREMAHATQGSFLFVDDAAELPGAFHRIGTNELARTLQPETPSPDVAMNFRPSGCGELRVNAIRDGRPAISVSDRGVEIIFDVSNSMWGRIDGMPKSKIASRTVQEVMDGLPDDLFVALRVYGHQYSSEQNNCEDSQLLIPLGVDNREGILRAIDGYLPKGQTPLGYSLEQVVEDFGDFDGSRSVMLITDGIETCDGDAVAAARKLQMDGRRRPVHVIGFGLEPGENDSLSGLQAIAGSTGGKFITAGNGEQLRRAMAATAGTAFTVWRGSQFAGGGTLGADDALRLPDGNYVLRLESDPPKLFPFRVNAGEALDLTLVREGERIFPRDSRSGAPYVPCTSIDEIEGQAKM